MIRLGLGVMSGWKTGFYAMFMPRLVNKRGGRGVCSFSSVSQISAGFMS